ncbi:MAG TPA: hypothetical protein VIC84_11135 [Blastocatellia bacterium]|jgi:hypothetical protein
MFGPQDVIAAPFPLQEGQVEFLQGATDAHAADRDFALVGDKSPQFFERRVGANFDRRLKRFELFFIE